MATKKTQEDYDAQIRFEAQKADIANRALQEKYDRELQLAQLKQQSSAPQTQQRQSSGYPLIDAFGSYIQDETQSDMFGSMGRSIGQTKLPSTGSWWQDLLIGGLQGATSGALNQIGSNNIRDNYNEQFAPVLNERFPGTDFTADLNSDFNPKVQMAQLLSALEDQKQENAIRMQLAQGLRLGGRDLDSVGGLGGLLGLGDSRARGGGVTLDENGVAVDDATGKPILKLPGVDEVRKAQDQAEILSIEDLADGLKEKGLSPSTINTMMRPLVEKQKNAINKGIPEAYSAASDLRTKAADIRQGIEDFGTTGPIIGPAKKIAASLGQALGIEEASKMLRGAQAFDVSAWKEAFKNKMPGAITEKELDKMLNLGGGVSADRLTNEKLAATAEKLAEIAQAYGDAQQAYLDDHGGNLSGFDTQWQKEKERLMGLGSERIGITEPSPSQPDLSRYTPAQIQYMRSKGMIK